jgi:hypothetical protein
MRRGGDLQERVTRVEAHVAAALALWRAGQPGRCDECGLSLQAAIGELEDAYRNAGRSGPSLPAPLAQRLERLQTDVNRLTRLVDAATAFCRGMALTIGRDGTPSPMDEFPAAERVA